MPRLRQNFFKLGALRLGAGYTIKMRTDVVNTLFQGKPEVFDRVEIWAVWGLVWQNLNAVYLEPTRYFVGFVVCFVVLHEDEILRIDWEKALVECADI